MVSSLGRIVSSRGRRRNIRGKNVNNFKLRKFAGERDSGLPEPWAGPISTCCLKRSGLFAGRREQVPAAADGADDGGVCRIRLDLAADAHDTQIDGAIEGFAVARICELEQSLAREHALRIGGEDLEQA